MGETHDPEAREGGFRSKMLRLLRTRVFKLREKEKENRDMKRKGMDKKNLGTQQKGRYRWIYPNIQIYEHTPSQGRSHDLT
jgi:hypothetical protein